MDISNISSLNVKGFRDASKRQKIFGQNISDKCKILFLQETHGNKFVNQCIAKNFKANVSWFSSVDQAARGVAILVKGDDNTISCCCCCCCYPLLRLPTLGLKHLGYPLSTGGVTVHFSLIPVNRKPGQVL